MRYRDEDEAWWAEATRDHGTPRGPHGAPEPADQAGAYPARPAGPPPQDVRPAPAPQHTWPVPDSRPAWPVPDPRPAWPVPDPRHGWPVPAAPPASGEAGGRSLRTWLLVGGALLLVGAVVLALVLVRRSSAPSAPSAPSATSDASPAAPQVDAPPAPLAVAATSPSCPPASNVDAAGTRFTYGSENAVDGDPATAWRCAGDGVGQRLVLTLAGRRTVSAVGLIPGFDKIDPADGADRWVQSPRVSSALWSFDDGSTREQRFDTDVGPAARRLQTMAVPATTTSRVTVTILAIDPGRATAQGGPAAFGGFSEAGVFGR